jgi:GAF domain-containing protein
MNSDVCDGTSFADVAVRLQDLMLGNQPVPHMLDNLAGYAAQRLGGPGRDIACNITLARPKKPVARAASSSLARLMHQLEGAYADSPGATAVRLSQTVVVPDLRQEGRWPEFVLAGRRQGVLSVVSLPLLLDADDHGLFSLYSSQPEEPGSGSTASAEAFVAQASKGLRLALRMAKLQDTKDGLSAAMKTRTVIDLATGAIMAQSRCGQAAAFKVLRDASNTRNIKLREIASGVISSVAGGAETFTYFDE